MILVATKLPAATAARLKAHAKRRGDTVSGFIRQLIEREVGAPVRPEEVEL